jgi:hypothetical protein
MNEEYWNSLINSILNEWAFRLKDGTPDIADLRKQVILREVLTEKGIDQDAIQLIINNLNSNGITEAKKDTKDLEAELKAKLPALKFDSAVQAEIIKVFNKMNTKEQQAVLDNFQKHSVKNYASKEWKTYQKFFSIMKKEMGRGEVEAVMCIAGAKSGGSATKDIVLPNGEIEVKELNASNDFRTGKSGAISNSPLIDELLSFKQNFLVKYGDDFVTFMENALVPESFKIYMKNVHTPLMGKFPVEFSSVPMRETPKIFAELATYFKNNDAPELNVLAVNDKDEYAISDKDADKIDTNKKVSIEIGDKIGDTNTLDIIFKQLKKFKYVKDVKSIEADTQYIVNKYADSMLGIIIHRIGSSTPIYLNSADMKKRITALRVSQNQFKFQLPK